MLWISALRLSMLELADVAESASCSIRTMLWRTTCCPLSTLPSAVCAAWAASSALRATSCTVAVIWFMAVATCILLATSCSTIVGFLSVAFMQRLRVWDPVVLAYLIPGALALGGFMALLGTMSATALAGLSSILGNLTLFGLIMVFLLIGALRKGKVYEAFI